MRDILLIEKALRTSWPDTAGNGRKRPFWKRPETPATAISPPPRHGRQAGQGRAPAVAEEIKTELCDRFPDSSRPKSPAPVHQRHVRPVVLAGRGRRRGGAGKAFGSSKNGSGRRIVVEYVSANPTGPLHIDTAAAPPWAIRSPVCCALPDTTCPPSTTSTTPVVRCVCWAIPCICACAKSATCPWCIRRSQGLVSRRLHPRHRPRNAGQGSFPDRASEPRLRICATSTPAPPFWRHQEDLREFRVELQVWFSEKSLVDACKVEEASTSCAPWASCTTRTTPYARHAAVRRRQGPRAPQERRYLTYLLPTSPITPTSLNAASMNASTCGRGSSRLRSPHEGGHHLQKHVRKDFHVVLNQMVNLMRGGEPVAMSTRSANSSPCAKCSTTWARTPPGSCSCPARATVRSTSISIL